MGEPRYPWRPLGGLLVERGLLTERELGEALVEQRVSGRLLGQILVDRECLSGFTLTRALVEQHGVTLRSKAGPPLVRTTKVRTWRPLGRLLVERRVVDEADLRAALEEQRRSRRRLGEILVAEGFVSGLTLARALAEQHGLDPERFRERDGLETAILPAPGPAAVYEVVAAGVRVESENFLEAADAAADLAARPGAGRVELRRRRGASAETVWTSDAETTPDRLVETFGFDPTRWG